MRLGRVLRHSQHPGGDARPAPAAAWSCVGAVNGREVVTGNNQEGVALAVTDLLLEGATEMLTLLSGRDADPGLADLVTAHVARRDRRVEVVCYDGGMASSLLQIGAE
jgi:dihydroxyacetone kinase-like predicted kinase